MLTLMILTLITVHDSDHYNNNNNYYDYYYYDFDPPADPALEFPSGSEIGFRSCANITIIDDMKLENDEDFTVGFNTTDPVVLFPNEEKNITILNNDCMSKIILAKIYYVEKLVPTKNYLFLLSLFISCYNIYLPKIPEETMMPIISRLNS